MTPKILVFAGSIRPGALSEKLAVIAAQRLRGLGADVTHISLKDYPLPFVGTGIDAPAEATALRKLSDAHHGLFLVSPEYNAGYTPLMKNALDWMSQAPKGGPATTFAGKVVGLGGTTAGSFGAMRALIQLRTILELGFGATLVPQMAAVGLADKVLQADGTISDERSNGMLDATLSNLVRMCRALNA